MRGRCQVSRPEGCRARNHLPAGRPTIEFHPLTWGALLLLVWLRSLALLGLVAAVPWSDSGKVQDWIDSRQGADSLPPGPKALAVRWFDKASQLPRNWPEEWVTLPILVYSMATMILAVVWLANNAQPGAGWPAPLMPPASTPVPTSTSTPPMSISVVTSAPAAEPGGLHGQRTAAMMATLGSFTGCPGTLRRTVPEQPENGFRTGQQAWQRGHTVTTPPAKAGGFLRSSLPQQRLLCLRTGYCPTLATQGSVRAHCQCDWRHAPAYDDPISFTLDGCCVQQPGELMLLSRCEPTPVDVVPRAIEAASARASYHPDVEIRVPAGLRPCSIPLPAKAGSPLEYF